MESTTTIAQLDSAAPLSDGDFLAVGQPGVFNLVTGQNGVTRKVTVKELADYYRVVGAGIISFREISPFECAKKRLLPLKYQIIEIAMYQELCDLMWVGAPDNAAANFWYKCDADGTRNANGLYMRVADARGLFPRFAGQNAVFTAANNTPYDGNGIGTFLGDTSRSVYGELGGFFSPGVDTAEGVFFQNIRNPLSTLEGGGYTGAVINIVCDLSRAVPVSHEFRGASISVSAYISY